MLAVFKKQQPIAGKTSRRVATPSRKRDSSVSHPAFKALVVLNICGALVAAYLYFNRQERPMIYQSDSEVKQTTTPIDGPVQSTVEQTSVKKSNLAPASQQSRTTTLPPKKNTPLSAAATQSAAPSGAAGGSTSYTVAGQQVYFHNKPDEHTRRNAFINRWNKAVLTPLNEENGFVYIVYTNHQGHTSKGWMLKKELTPIH